MRFILAGQPNSGKSSIFNSVAGYRSATANFPKSSVTFTATKALIAGREVEVIDLPGIYSLTSSDSVSGPAERYLLDEKYDLIINVVDASRLGRSLELTFQLLELNRPMIVALNMMDEARRRGSEIDHLELSSMLGVPVVTTTSRLGRGLKQLYRESLRHGVFAEPASSPIYDNEVEGAIAQLASVIDGRDLVSGVPATFGGHEAPRSRPARIQARLRPRSRVGRPGCRDRPTARRGARMERRPGRVGQPPRPGPRGGGARGHSSEPEDRMARTHRYVCCSTSGPVGRCWC